MMKKITILFIILQISVLFVTAQCPRNEENCKGLCGRFIDENDDGYCDNSKLSKTDATSGSTISKEHNENKTKQNSKHSSQRHCNITEDDTATNHSVGINSEKENIIIQNDDDNFDTNESEGEKTYKLITITAIILAAYLITSILSRKKIIKKQNHRKFWNVILAITFVVSALLGLFLVVQINYGIRADLFREALYHHVQFGIAMGIIGILHLLWHWKYFKNIFNSKKDNNE